jgi:hypothetical protein
MRIVRCELIGRAVLPTEDGRKKKTKKTWMTPNKSVFGSDEQHLLRQILFTLWLIVFKMFPESCTSRGGDKTLPSKNLVQYKLEDHCILIGNGSKRVKIKVESLMGIIAPIQTRNSLRKERFLSEDVFWR